jgi:hypothetical protein
VKGNAKFEGYIHQYGSSNAFSQKTVSGAPQQCHKNIEEAELLWPLW